MAKPKPEEPKPVTQRVFLVYKDESMQGYAQAFGLVEVDMDKETLIKHGKVISQSEPDIAQIFMSNLEKKVRASLGI